MNLLKILKAAEALNYQLVTHEANDGFYTYFVKDNEVKGLVKADASGWSYKLPEDVQKTFVSEPIEGDYIPDPNPEC